MSGSPARHVVLAPDKFKGSLTAAEVASHLRSGIQKAARDVTVTSVPVADGGEGTVEAALASGFQAVPVRVHGPTGKLVDAFLAVREDTAIVELAQASGLHHVVPDGPTSLLANTYGTGELVVAALDSGCSTVILGIGGSATTDGGAGMLQALGAKLRDDRHHDLPAGRGHCVTAYEVDISGVDRRVAHTKFVVASDVDNVLHGPRGAAAVFAPQKGATPPQVAQLDEGLERWAQLVDTACGTHAAVQPGAGAAGGAGFAALAVLRAELRPGIDVLLELTDFPELLHHACLVVTGEGSLDEQSLGGKAPVGVARLAEAAGVKTVAVAGRTTLSQETLRAAGFAGSYSLNHREPDLALCIRDAPRLLDEVGRAIARDWL